MLGSQAQTGAALGKWHLVTSDACSSFPLERVPGGWIQEFSFPVHPWGLDLATLCDLEQGT